ncbi:MAG: PHP domain-containing protein [Dehalococcoidia bacterium]|nr:PHP domain-containing protein [Dehalococcoidia bacterium]
MAVVDLHLHTTASDGRLTPGELIALVARKGLQVVSVTDHDSTEGLAEALEAAKAFPNLTVIPGIELSTDIPGDEIHVLAYFVRHKDEELLATLRKFRQGRLERGRGMVEKLRDMGMDIEWQRVQEIAGDGAVGRPHVALALMEKGYVSQTNEAFEKYLGRNGPAYVEREKLTPVDAVEAITSWGGVAVLAHPAQLLDLDVKLEELRSAGLVGMEVYYAQYSEERILELASTAARHGLLPCGGSD